MWHNSLEHLVGTKANRSSFPWSTIHGVMISRLHITQSVLNLCLHLDAVSLKYYLPMDPAKCISRSTTR